MKSLLAVTMVAACFSGSASAQNAPMFNPASEGEARYLRSFAIEREYKAQLIALRHEALLQRDQDGGSLSPVSRSRLQAKLDDLNRKRARFTRNNAFYSVDASGKPLPRPLN